MRKSPRPAAPGTHPGRLYAQSVRLISADHRPLWPSLADRPTSHTFWALYLALSDGLSFVCDDGSEHAVGPDRITLIPPWLPFRHRFPTGCCHAYVLFELPHVPPATGLRACGGRIHALTDPGAVAVMRSFARDAQAGLPLLERALRAQAVATLGFLALLASLGPSERALMLDPGIAAGRLQPALEWIDANLDRSIALADLARILDCSEDHCSRLFRQQLQRSPMNYLTHRRLHRAGVLLADSSLGLDDIAQACGLGTRRYLGRLFRQWVGISPSAYRQRLATGQELPSVASPG